MACSCVWVSQIVVPDILVCGGINSTKFGLIDCVLECLFRFSRHHLEGMLNLILMPVNLPMVWKVMQVWILEMMGTPWLQAPTPFLVKFLNLNLQVSNPTEINTWDIVHEFLLLSMLSCFFSLLFIDSVRCA